MRGNIIGLSIVGTCALLLSACSQSPMSALKSDSVNQTYNSAYWSKQREAKAPIWQEALDYCKANPDKVNCHPVRMSLFFGDDETPKPGKPVSLPSFDNKSSTKSK